MWNEESEPDDLSMTPESLKRLREIKRDRPWKLYHPIPAIEPFHSSEAAIRVLAGPNRGGKTTAGAFELVCYATGWNPIRKQKYKTPNVCWAIALDHQNMGSIQRRTLFRMLPRGFKWLKMESRIILPAPWHSEIVLKSADSGREKFQGEGLTAAWFDEEPVGEPGHEIFKEVFARRKPGVPLNIFMTFTPLQGQSWSYRVLWNPKSPDRIRAPIDTFSFDLHDCEASKGGFLSTEEIATIESGYSYWERKARIHGQYTIMGGTPYFDPGLLMDTLKRCETVVRYEIRQKSGVLPGISSIQMETRDDGPLRVVRPPLKGHNYMVGVDVGGGVGRDATVASVWDRDDLVEVAQWHSNSVDPKEFGAFILPALGAFYNLAQVVVEVNGEHGGTVVNEMRGKYKRMYVRQNWDNIHRKPVNEYGFRTTTRTRGMILDTLNSCLRQQAWLPCAETIEEMGSFIIKQNNDAEAMDGTHDDRVFAAGIALVVHFENPTPKIDLSQCRIEYQKGPEDWVNY